MRSNYIHEFLNEWHGLVIRQSNRIISDVEFFGEEHVDDLKILTFCKYTVLLQKKTFGRMAHQDELKIKMNW